MQHKGNTIEFRGQMNIYHQSSERRQLYFPVMYFIHTCTSVGHRKAARENLLTSGKGYLSVDKIRTLLSLWSWKGKVHTKDANSDSDLMHNSEPYRWCGPSICSFPTRTGLHRKIRNTGPICQIHHGVSKRKLDCTKIQEMWLYICYVWKTISILFL